MTLPMAGPWTRDNPKRRPLNRPGRSRVRVLVRQHGRLVLAIALSLVGMGVLAALNVHFLRQPQRVSGPLTSGPDEAGDRLFGRPATAAPDDSPESPVQPRPEVTFYRKLTANSPAGKIDNPLDFGSITEADLAQPSGSGSPNPTPPHGSPPSAYTGHDRTPHGSLPDYSDPDGKDGAHPIYTVQVGAFSKPGVALQWAKQWKAKGFRVTLKPAARPGVGVIYRLYLGSFTSKDLADDLVRRLKSREGISAFRVTVRK